MILLWGMSGDEPLTAVTASLHRRNEPYALWLSSPAWSFYLTGDPLNRVQIATATGSR